MKAPLPGRLTLRAFLGAVLVCAGAAQANTLVDRAAEAARLCGRIEAASLEECGNMIHASAEANAARRAIRELFRERSLFINACSIRHGSATCLDIANNLVAAGVDRAAR